MRLGLLSLLAVAGLLSSAVSREAAAAPVTTAGAHTISGSSGSSIESVYYYRGGYYPYRYGGMYYRHRYYRYGRWHYY